MQGVTGCQELQGTTLDVLGLSARSVEESEISAHGAPPGKVQTYGIRGYGCSVYSCRAARHRLLRIIKRILHWETAKLELTTPEDEKGKRGCLGGTYKSFFLFCH